MINTNIDYETLSSEVSDMLMSSKYTRSYNELLAKELNKTKAIFINQIHYWTTILRDEKHFHEGRYWVYESYKSWQKQFPSMTTRQIQNILISLEADGYILVGNFNEKDYDKTKWYAVNYEKVKEVLLNQGKKQEDAKDPYEIISSPPYEKISIPPYEKSSSPIPNISIPNNSTPNNSINSCAFLENAPRIDDLGLYMFHVRRAVMNSERIISKDKVVEAMEYFFRQYAIHKGENHIKLKKETIESIGEKLDVFADDLKIMIDRYFSTDFREDYCSLSHFASDNILELKAYETGALGPVLQLSYA